MSQKLVQTGKTLAVYLCKVCQCPPTKPLGRGVVCQPSTGPCAQRKLEHGDIDGPCGAQKADGTKSLHLLYSC